MKVKAKVNSRTQGEGGGRESAEDLSANLPGRTLPARHVQTATRLRTRNSLESLERAYSRAFSWKRRNKEEEENE